MATRLTEPPRQQSPTKQQPRTNCAQISGIQMANGNLSCADFTSILARRSEHIADEILADLTPIGNINSMVETGVFKPHFGTTQTFDKFNRVAVNHEVAWAAVSDETCVGTPCDPTETKLCFGSTREDYHLQTKSFATDLFCYDQMLTIDKAKEHYANAVKQLKDAQKLIIGNRIRTEMFRIAQYKWLAGGGNASGLTPFTYTVTLGNHINIRITGGAVPSSKMVVNMLKRRLAEQILNGAVGETPMGQPPELEVLTDMDTIWDLIQGDSNLSDKWRFDAFTSGAPEYYKYGWSGRVGNFNLKADIHPMRFQILANGDLNQVFAYSNQAASSGIKGIPNQAYLDAPIQALFIWHRRGMRQEVLDATQIHPMMPFVPRSFGGKWQFVMDNLTCGTANGTDPVTGLPVTIPIAVDNSRRNKGKFVADFKFATKAQFPEFVEVFLHLRENAPIVEVPPCDDGPAYVTQDYSSDCGPCPELVVQLPS
jgi:hypothetical protein